MRTNKMGRRRAGMTARLEEEITSQKAVLRRIDPLTETQAVAAAQSRLTRLEDLMEALIREPAGT